MEPPSPRRVLLTVNERARRGAGARERAARALRNAGHEVTEVPCGTALSRAIAAKRGGIDAVAVGGGDGTLVAAVDGIRAAGVPLLILPLGTVNELARTLRIPSDLEDACALLGAGLRKAIDVASVNGHSYLNEASIGFSTLVAARQTEDVKSRLGPLTVPLTTLRSLRALRPYHLEVTTERGVHAFRTVQLTVANSYRFGAVVENDEARLDDGLLELYSLDVRNALDALGVVAAVAVRRFPQARCVTELRSARFVVRSRHSHRVFADGEPIARTPAEFRVLERALEVFVPPQALAR